VVFAGVATIVSFLVTRHIEVFGRTDHQRQVLLRSVSHDLRTPLSVIRGASSELLDGTGAHDEKTRRRLLELVGDESERLDRLVANLLSLSRIEAGAMHPDRQSVDLRELVDELVNRLARLFVDLDLQVDIADDVPTIDVDYTMFDQVLSNLLENAARHSPPGGTVRISARVLEEVVVRIWVTDSGPGVDPADATRIFEPFRSGPIAGTSGIGLAICKAVVEAHGGTISVGGGNGSGATFVITLVA
jgi:two-component system sensor histidine kinase KdpD